MSEELLYEVHCVHCEALMEVDYDPPFHNCAICDECYEKYHIDPSDENALEEFEA